jgi:hypothetical protein
VNQHFTRTILLNRRHAENNEEQGKRQKRNQNTNPGRRHINRPTEQYQNLTNNTLPGYEINTGKKKEPSGSDWEFFYTVYKREVCYHQLHSSRLMEHGINI